MPLRGAAPGERRHEDPVRQVERAELKRGEEIRSAHKKVFRLLDC